MNSRVTPWLARTPASIFLCGIFLAGCGSDPISSHAYQYALALYSTSNLQDLERMAGLAGQMEDSHAAGELNQREYRMLHRALTAGQTGRWERARALSREILEAEAREG